MNAKRGYVPEDERNFSLEAIHTMKTASRHVRYLINEGCDLKQASTFVGNHFLLSERQRLAIMRSLATDEQLAVRQSRQVQMSDLDGKEVWIECFQLRDIVKQWSQWWFIRHCMETVKYGCDRLICGMKL